MIATSGHAWRSRLMISFSTAVAFFAPSILSAVSQ